MNSPSPTDLQRVAEEAAGSAGTTAVAMQKEALSVTQKGYRDFVSEADFASQKTIFDFIGNQFPDHEYLSEEADISHAYSGPVLWIIDPIDGTTNYIKGQPQFTISIASAVARNRMAELTKSDSNGINNSSSSEQPRDIYDYQLAAGVVFDPHQNELFSANIESSSSLNRSPIQVSDVQTLDKAVVGIDWSRDYKQRQHMLEIINRIAHKVHTLRAMGSAAQALAWVACGRLDAYINLGVGPWDVAAAKIILERAGGHVTDIKGESWELWHGGCVASTAALHSQVLALTK